MRNRPLSTVFIPALMLALGTSAYAGTVWDPASNGITPPATGNWNVAARCRLLNNSIRVTYDWSDDKYTLKVQI